MKHPSALSVRARAVLRLARVALHLLRGLVTVACIYPRVDMPRKLALKQRWSARLLEILGISLNYAGKAPHAGLMVANHISFIDIFAINALVPSSFVSKDDVHAWPVIGWLAKHTDTLFLERGSRAAAQRARENIVGHLRAQTRVVVFPEGTTTLGDHVLPFHSALFQSAIDANVDVTPIAITYVDGTAARTYAAAFAGDTTLVQCLWSIACAPRITVRVNFLPLLPTAYMERRELSTKAHRAISHHVAPTH